MFIPCNILNSPFQPENIYLEFSAAYRKIVSNSNIFLDILGTVQIWAFKSCFVEMMSTVCIILLYDNAFIIHFSIHTTWSTY